MRSPDPAIAKLLGAADAAMARGAFADSGRMLDEARGLAPEDPDLWLAIARLRWRGGEHLTAIEAADRALARAPDHAPALLLRALTVREAHGASAALAWFAAARRVAPGDPEILAEHAATLGDAGKAGAMLEAVRTLAAAAPQDPRVPWLQAVLAARGGEYAIARSLLARSGMAARDVPAALLLDALISLEEGNADSAAATLEKLAARQPANVRVRELHARALLAGGREDELVARFGREADRPETSPYLAMLVARAHERRGERAAAAPLLERVRARIPDGPVVLAVREALPPATATVRGMLLAGDVAESRREAAGLLARFSASADVATLAGDALLGGGDPQSALEAYTRAATARRPWSLARKAAWTHARLGNRQASGLLLARHVAGEPHNADALLALAANRAAQGEWQRVASLLDYAAALGAGHDPALLDLRIRAARSLGRADQAERLRALRDEVLPRRLAGR